MAIVTRVLTYDDETDEVFSDMSYDHNDYEIRAVHKNTIKAYKERKNRMEAHDGERYTKVYCERFDGYLEGENGGEVVTDGEARMALACILKSYKYGGVELSYRNNVPLNALDLIKAAGMTERSGFRALSSLVKRGILAKEREGRNYRYYINPYLVFAGKQAEAGTFERFANTMYAERRTKE